MKNRILGLALPMMLSFSAYTGLAIADCNCSGSDKCVKLINWSTGGHIKGKDTTTGETVVKAESNGKTYYGCLNENHNLKFVSSNQKGSATFNYKHMSFPFCRKCTDDANDMVCGNC